MITSLYANYQGNPEYLIISMRNDVKAIKEKYAKWNNGCVHIKELEISPRVRHKRIMERFDENRDKLNGMTLLQIAICLNCSKETARTLCRDEGVRYKKLKKGRKV